MPTKSRSRTTTNDAAGSARALVRRRLPTALPPTAPGEMLLEEFLKPLGISQSAFAIRLGVSFPRLNEIIRGKRAVTPDTALRLAQVTGMSADFLARPPVRSGSVARAPLEGRQADCQVDTAAPRRLTPARARAGAI